MSLCLYLSDSEAQQFHDFVNNSPLLYSRKNIGYHIIFKTGVRQLHIFLKVFLLSASADWLPISACRCTIQ